MRGRDPLRLGGEEVLSRGAGATTSTQMPSRCTVSTTGQQRT